MTCAIHNFGANVFIESGIDIIYESTNTKSTSIRKLEGTVEKIDRINHKITVKTAEYGNIIVDADNVKKK